MTTRLVSMDITGLQNHLQAWRTRAISENANIHDLCNDIFTTVEALLDVPNQLPEVEATYISEKISSHPMHPCIPVHLDAKLTSQHIQMHWDALQMHGMQRCTGCNAIFFTDVPATN